MSREPKRLVALLVKLTACMVGLLAFAFLAAGIRWTVKESRGEGLATQPLLGIQFSLSQALLLGAGISIVVAVLLFWFAGRIIPKWTNTEVTGF